MIRLRPTGLSFLACIAFLAAPASAERDPEPTKLECLAGPVEEQLGGSDWLAFACNDNKSLVFVSAPDNPANPFYFVVSTGRDGVIINGEGNGDKALTSAASEQLKSLTNAELGLIFEAAATVSREVVDSN